MNISASLSALSAAFLTLAVGLLSACGSDRRPQSDPNPTRLPEASVLVIGGIHQAHEDARIYTYERMGELFRALAPDILCVEVQQRYVDDGSLQGMPFDFKRAMVPAAREMGVPIVGIDWWDDARGDQWLKLQEQAAKDSSLRPEMDVAGSLFEHLGGYFQQRDFADINSRAVTELWAAKNRFKYRALAARPAYASIVAFETERNENMAQKTLAAIEHNPNKRILVAVGIDHKYFIEQYLAARSVRLAQAEELVPGRDSTAPR